MIAGLSLTALDPTACAAADHICGGMVDDVRRRRLSKEGVDEMLPARRDTRAIAATLSLDHEARSNTHPSL